MSQSAICEAVRNRNLVRFHYSLSEEPGFRIVEPHMVAYNEAGNLSLSAWFLRGSSESKEGAGWREYLVSSISNVTVLSEQFPGPRPGYDPTGGKRFSSIQCAL